MIQKRVFLATLCTFLALAYTNSFASPKVSVVTPLSGAHGAVQQLTEQMMAIIRDKQALYQKNPEQYFKSIQDKLEPSIEFVWIAKTVMGKHYRSSTKSQRTLFAQAFTRSLVEMLGKGMASYSSADIITVPPKTNKNDLRLHRKVYVKQSIQAPSGSTKLTYTLRQNKNAQWKVINISLNGTNLGQQLHKQFSQSMRVNDNSLDSVIAQWGKQPKQVKVKAQQ